MRWCPSSTAIANWGDFDFGFFLLPLRLLTRLWLHLRWLCLLLRLLLWLLLLWLRLLLQLLRTGTPLTPSNNLLLLLLLLSCHSCCYFDSPISHPQVHSTPSALSLPPSFPWSPLPLCQSESVSPPLNCFDCGWSCCCWTIYKFTKITFFAKFAFWSFTRHHYLFVCCCCFVTVSHPRVSNYPSLCTN